jgi:hypothetical protein
MKLLHYNSIDLRRLTVLDSISSRDTSVADDVQTDGRLQQPQPIVRTHLQLAHLLVRARDEMSTVTAILVELAESYQAVVDECPSPSAELPVIGRLVQAAGMVFSYGQLEMIVQEALAAYEWQVVRLKPVNMGAHAGCGDDGHRDAAAAAAETADDVKRAQGAGHNGCDVSEWAALISSKVEGRVRLHMADVTSTDAVRPRTWHAEGSSGE